MANNMGLADALAYYKNVAACFPDIPGSTHPTVHSIVGRLCLFDDRGVS